MEYQRGEVRARARKLDKDFYVRCVKGENIPALTDPNHKLTPEQELVAAILHQAFEDSLGIFHCHRSKAQQRRLKNKYKRLQRDALRWLVSNDDTEVFSFVNCCSYLGFNPSYIRRMHERFKKGTNKGVLKVAGQHQHTQGPVTSDRGEPSQDCTRREGKLLDSAGGHDFLQGDEGGGLVCEKAHQEAAPLQGGAESVEASLLLSLLLFRDEGCAGDGLLQKEIQGA